MNAALNSIQILQNEMKLWQITTLKIYNNVKTYSSLLGLPLAVLLSSCASARRGLLLTPWVRNDPNP